MLYVCAQAFMLTTCVRVYLTNHRPPPYESKSLPEEPPASAILEQEFSWRTTSLHRTRARVYLKNHRPPPYESKSFLKNNRPPPYESMSLPEGLRRTRARVYLKNRRSPPYARARVYLKNHQPPPYAGAQGQHSGALSLSRSYVLKAKVLWAEKLSEALPLYPDTVSWYWLVSFSSLKTINEGLISYIKK